MLYISNASTLGNFGAYAGTANGFPAVVVEFASNVARSHTVVFNGSASQIGANGTISTISPGANTMSTPRIGVSWSGVYQSGDYAEVIVYNSALTRLEQQQVEGYLGWKWGLVPQLINPLNIAGCSLWLDSADSSTVTLSGSNVTAWRDKSGANISLNVIGTPVQNALLKNKPIINLTNGRFTGTLPSPLTNYQNTTFIVTYLNSYPTAGYSCMMFVSNLSTVNAMHRVLDYATTFRAVHFNPANLTYITTMAASPLATPFLWTMKYNGSNLLSISRNGAATTASTTPTSPGVNAGAFYIGGDPTVVGVNTWPGYVAEIITYNSFLSTGETQLVEGYLGDRWGIRSNFSTTATPLIPLVHPFYRNPPISRILNAVDIEGCSVWFDAADESTITGTTAITAWRTKGEIPITAVTNSGTLVSRSSNINGLNAVFVPGNATLTCSTVALANQARSVFVIHRVDTSIPGYQSFFSVRSASTYNSGHIQLMNSTQTDYAMYAHGQAGDSNILQAVTQPAKALGTTDIVCWVQSATSATSNAITVNGTSLALATSQIASTYSNVSAIHYIGNAYPQPYVLGEYVLFNTFLVPRQRQQIEGYLAWKWKLQSKLPTTHPFKLLPPYTTVFSPIQLSNLMLWLDAADPESLDLCGNTVVRWYDKSGLGRHASQATATRRPVFQSNQWNGLPGIKWDGVDDNLCNTNFGYPTNGLSTLFVVYNLTSIVTDQRVFDINGNFYGNFISPSSTGDALLGLATGGRRTTLARSTGWRMYSLRYAGSGSAIWRNGTAQATSLVGTMGSNATGTSYTLGNNSGGTNSLMFSGHIGEIIMYSNNLSTYQHQQVEGYLANKWGFRSGMPTSHMYFKSTP